MNRLTKIRKWLIKYMLENKVNITDMYIPYLFCHVPSPKSGPFLLN